MSDLALPPPRAPGPLGRAPALLAAIALHAALLALLVLGPHPKMPPVGSSVPINIVSTAPATDTRPAVEAPQAQAAATPAPEPQAPPQPPAPAVAPPAFSKSVPTPPKAQKPVPQPQPAVHAAAPAARPFDFNHLQQIIDNAQKNAGKPTASARKGPTQAETDTHARPDAGQGISESDQAGLQQLLERLWVLPCGEPGIGSVAPFKVTFTVLLSGRLLSPPTAHGAENASGLTALVVRRALDAVRAAEPFAPPYYGQTITVNFNSKKAYASKCSD
jgi:outer membrane biosynthesis protein TonB